MNERTEKITDTIEVRYSWDFDDDSDLSWLGVFVARASATTYRRKNPGWGNCEYIEPGQTFEERRDSYLEYFSEGEHKSDKPHTDAAWRAGHELREDMEMLEKYNDGRLWDEICTATLYIDGAEVASAALHGIGDPDDAYRREIEKDLRGDVLAEAGDNLKREAQRAAERLVKWREYEGAQENLEEIPDN